VVGQPAPTPAAFDRSPKALPGVLQRTPSSRRKRISKVDAEYSLSIKGLPIRLTDPLCYDGVFALADCHGLTVCEAAYLALAAREGLPLASLDAALIRAAGQSGVGFINCRSPSFRPGLSAYWRSV